MHLLIALGIFAVAFLFFGHDLAAIPTFIFDENVYVEAARHYLRGNGHINLEHPPLAKLMIAASMLLFGDNAIAWRLPSLCFAAASVALIYLWTVELLKWEKNTRGTFVVTAVCAAAFTMLNQLAFVHARLAMLEAPLVAWMLLAIFLMTRFLRRRDLTHAQESRRILLIGCAVGLAIATKWVGLVLLPPALLTLILYFRFRPAALVQQSALLVVSAVATYALSWLPLGMLTTPAFTNPGDWFDLHLLVYRSQSHFSAFHPYASSYLEWPLMLRPTWYAMLPNADRSGARFVWCIGNPVVMWFGLLSVLYNLRAGLLFGSRAALLSAFWYFWLWGAWALNPRPLTLYYYYYPAAMGLSVNIVVMLWQLGENSRRRDRTLTATILAATAACFFFFWPLLTGAEVQAKDFSRWIWFKSWNLSTQAHAQDPESAPLVPHR